MARRLVIVPTTKPKSRFQVDLLRGLTSRALVTYHRTYLAGSGPPKKGRRISHTGRDDYCVTTG
jgi:hypothetical protein